MASDRSASFLALSLPNHWPKNIMRMKRAANALNVSMALLLIASSLIIGRLHYYFLGLQLDGFWEHSVNPLSISDSNPHKLRYFIIYPAYLLGSALNSIPLGHTIYGLILLAMSIALWLRLGSHLASKPLRIVGVDISFLLYLLASLYFVNGRGLIVWFAALLSFNIECTLKKNEHMSPWLRLALIVAAQISTALGAVSSGAFFVLGAYNLYLLWLASSGLGLTGKMLIGLMSGLMTAWVIPLADAYLEKIFDFFDNSFVAILGHGLLSLGDVGLLALLACASAAALLIFINLLYSSMRLEFKSPPLFLVPSVVFPLGYLFGFTAGLPALLLFLICLPGIFFKFISFALPR
jgi:hypothetical protein